jgi:hypothetical protein
MEESALAQQRFTQYFELCPAEIPTPLTFREGGRKHRVLHVFRPPTFVDWLEYERLLNSSVETTGGYTRFEQARAEAAEAIWNRISLRVEGYMVRPSAADFIPRACSEPVEGSESDEGSAPVQLPDAFPDSHEGPRGTWREKVPLLHKMAAVTLLAQVMASDAGDVEAYSFDPDQIQVFLDAARGGRKYEGLIHVLRRPTVRQQKEFSRVVSSALYVRGSRTEKSMLPSRLKEMVKFYDELIVEAKGYCLGGHPERAERVEGSALSREDAIRHMDAMHKKTAVSALFSFEDSGPDSENEVV